MNRIDRVFAALRARGERALVAYLTAGDPSLELTRRLVVEAARAGADIVELGVPFSDPIADGPVIQRAAQRALAAGATLRGVLDTVRAVRAATDVPVVLLTYYNSLLNYGLGAFAGAARAAGVDGLVVADLPPDEAGPLTAEAGPAGLHLVHLVAPTSTPARVRLVARRSGGFIYVVSLMGVTGERQELPLDLAPQLARLRRVTTTPVCVGFGIGRPEQVAAVGSMADGVIVGSAIVRRVETHGASADCVPEVGRFVAALKAPLRAS